MKKRIWLLYALICLCLLSSCLYLSACASYPSVDKVAKTLSSYTIEAGFDEEEKCVSAVEELNFYNNTGREIAELRLHLYPNAYRENVQNKPVSSAKSVRAYPNGFDYGDIEIEYAKQDDADLAFEIVGEEQNILLLPLSAPVKDGQCVTVEISFCTRLANILHRLGYGDNTVNLNNWFPVLCKYDQQKGWLQDVYCSTGDPFVADVANFDVALTLPSQYVLAVGADLVDSTPSEDSQCVRHHYQAKAIRDFSIVMSKKFQVVECDVSGVAVKYYYFDDDKAQDTLNLSAKALEFYGDKFGKYPYATLAVAQSDFCEGGMEYPRLAMVTYGLEENQYKQAVAHEIAHQWWCCVVGNDQIREAWLDEGLAEYSTNLFFEFNDYGIDAKSEMRLAKQRLHDFLEITKNYFKETDTSLTRSIYDYRNETEYAYLNYVKSMVMFDDFRQLMGDKRFFKSLQTFYYDNMFKVADKVKLAQSFSDCYGADMLSLLENYLDGKEKTIAK